MPKRDRNEPGPPAQLRHDGKASRDHNRTSEALWARADPFELGRLRDEVRLSRFIETLSAHLRDARDAESALRFVVRACREYFGIAGDLGKTTSTATSACLAVIVPPGGDVELAFNLPQVALWDRSVFAAALRGEKPPTQPNLMFARIRRRERAWALLALRRHAGEFDRAERQALVRIGSAVSSLLHEIDLNRIREVRDRIDRKIMGELRPIDLSYQILDALRSLTGYDHSATMFTSDESGAALQVVAEQIAWRKAKSRRVGKTYALTPGVASLLEAGEVYSFARQSDGGWRELHGRSADELLHVVRLDEDDTASVREQQILCAPLGAARARGSAAGDAGLPALGVLKVSAKQPGTFGQHEAALLSAFLAQASIAVQNAQRAAVLESKMIAAERKHAMADLARGVSHDLNNALGAVLPLVQQLKTECQDHALDLRTAGEDLHQIEQSLHVCRRIFNGMLTFARRSASAIGQGHVRQAVDCTLAILGENMRRRGIEAQIDLPDDVPKVATAQNDLEQVFLNLLTNARDAMPDGGTLRVVAGVPSGNGGDARTLRVMIEDSGAGIAPEHLPMVLEPFFTTKSNGSGLGLSICRSIVWEIGGQIQFESTIGKGTKVTLTLPLAETQ